MEPTQDVGAVDLADSIRSGSMPPGFSVLMHTKAKRDNAQEGALIAGSNASVATSPPKGGGG